MLKKATCRCYPAETIKDVVYVDDFSLLANTHTQAKSLQHSLEQTVGHIGFYVNADKMEYMCFKREGTISTRNGGPFKISRQIKYLSSCVSLIESYVNMRLVKTRTAIDRLSIIWKSNRSDKIKLQTVVVSILLYGYTSWTLIKRIEKKLDGKCRRLL